MIVLDRMRSACVTATVQLPFATWLASQGLGDGGSVSGPAI
jgi:hypothetical protein